MSRQGTRMYNDNRFKLGLFGMNCSGGLTMTLALCENLLICGQYSALISQVGFSPLFLRFSIGKCRNCPFFRAF